MKYSEPLLFQIIDVADLQPITYKPNVSSAKIEEFAQAILQAGGLISPLLVRKVGLQGYQLINEELQGMEYLAVVRAKEINPRKAEMVNAFVISEDSTSSAISQLNLIQGN